MRPWGTLDADDADRPASLLGINPDYGSVRRHPDHVGKLCSVDAGYSFALAEYADVLGKADTARLEKSRRHASFLRDGYRRPKSDQRSESDTVGRDFGLSFNQS